MINDSEKPGHTVNLNIYRSIVCRLNQMRILVIGDIMLDRFILGTASRISPEAPVPLVEVTDELFQLGGAANAVNNIRALGGRVVIAGVVGNDWVGQRVIDLLKKDDIDISGIFTCLGRPTTIKSRIIAGEQQLLRYDREERESVSNDTSKKSLDFVKDNINSVDLILVSDYNKGIITRYLLEEVIDIARTCNIPVVVYPKIEPACIYKGVSLVITPIDDACRITGITQINETSLRNMGQWLLTHLGCDNILIIRGNDGMSLFQAQGEVIQIPPPNTESYHGLGSMDTIASIIALSLPSCISHVIDAATLANIGSSLMGVGKESGLVTQDALLNQIQLLESRLCN